MAHFAKIENNIVTEVIVVNNRDVKNLPFPESEPVGQSFIRSIGIEGEWVQTSYNGNFRNHYAGKGFIFDKELNMFYPPKPFESWILDVTTGVWQSPVERPDDPFYTWNEELKQWVLDPAFQDPRYEVE